MNRWVDVSKKKMKNKKKIIKKIKKLLKKNNNPEPKNVILSATILKEVNLNKVYKITEKKFVFF